MTSPPQLTNKISVCDVCKCVDKDFSEKEVQYCYMCNAWICKMCLTDWGRRAKAALKYNIKQHND